MRPQKQVSAEPPIQIDRLTFWSGQRLRSADLNRGARITEELQWWHNRAAHNAYGIRAGLGVVPEPSAKGKLLSAVRVDAGIAYDSFGRMLFHEQSELVPLPEIPPAHSTSLVLLLHYPQPPVSPCGCAVAPPCCLGHRPRHVSWAEFVWRDAGHVRPEEGVPIGRVKYIQTGKNLGAQFDAAFRQPRVRPYQRPHLVSDKTVPGSTSWGKGPVDLLIIPTTVRTLFWQPVDVLVDTSAAGFSGTPCYFASLSGSLVDESRRQYLPAVFPHIVREFRDRFTLRFWIPSIEDEILEHPAQFSPSLFPPGWIVGFPKFIGFARRQQLCITWVGCEMAQETSPQDFAALTELLPGCATSAAKMRRT
jgi:hypothetical protein